jgi:hypothetical protein
MLILAWVQRRHHEHNRCQRALPVSPVQPMIALPILIFAAFIFLSQLAPAGFSQQGPKLVGNDAIGPDSAQGWPASMPADGNTMIMGGAGDDGGRGAAWVFTRSGRMWTQQGGKLVSAPVCEVATAMALHKATPPRCPPTVKQPSWRAPRQPCQWQKHRGYVVYNTSGTRTVASPGGATGV